MANVPKYYHLENIGERDSGAPELLLHLFCSGEYFPK